MAFSHLIAASYRLGASRRFLRWLGFLLALFGTIYGVIYLGYQGVSTFLKIRGEGVEWSALGSAIFQIFGRDWGAVAGAGAGLVGLILLYLLVPTLLRGSLIAGLGGISRGETVSGSDAVGRGTMAYLPLFEHDLLFSALSIAEIATIGLFAFRNLPDGMVAFLLPLLGFFAFLILICRFLFVFAEFFIIFDEKKLWPALGASAALVVKNLKLTVQTLLVVGLVFVGLAVNLAVALALPAAAGWLLRATLETVPEAAALWVGGVASVLALIFLVQIFGRTTVFLNALWVKVFLLARDREKIAG